ncbi:MAG: hypothetical protein U9P81_00620 [Euryarchaeota archaeon]|nr:hypothetical protein [Euryarchaeota archaeon]
MKKVEGVDSRLAGQYEIVMTQIPQCPPVPNPAAVSLTPLPFALFSVLSIQKKNFLVDRGGVSIHMQSYRLY